MSRLFVKFQEYDRNVFMWINGRLHNRFMNFWLYYFTHLGGATSSIAVSLLIWLLAPAPWSTTGLQACIALAVSHIPVAIAKNCIRAFGLTWLYRIRLRSATPDGPFVPFRAYYCRILSYGSFYDDGAVPVAVVTPCCINCRIFTNLPRITLSLRCARRCYDRYFSRTCNSCFMDIM